MRLALRFQSRGKQTRVITPVSVGKCRIRLPSQPTRHALGAFTTFGMRLQPRYSVNASLTTSFIASARPISVRRFCTNSTTPTPDPAVMEEAAKWEKLGDEHVEKMAFATDIDTMKFHAVEAEKAFLEALRISRNAIKNPILLYGLGMARLKQRKFQLALNSFTEATKLDESYTPAHYGTAECLRQLRRYAEAVIAYTKVLETCENYYGRFPEDAYKNWDSESYIAEIMYKRAFCYVEIADLTMARNDCKVIIDSKVTNQWTVLAYVKLASIETMDTKFNNAIALCNKAIELDPKSIDAYVQRSQTYLLMGKDKEAEEDKKRSELLKREKLWKRQLAPA